MPWWGGLQSAKTNDLDRIQDPQRFGVFPQFSPYWDLAAASDTLTSSLA
jgi:hypothetical protein